MIRPATPEDAGAIVGLVRELAAYERAPDQVALDEAALRASLFCEHPLVFVHVAEHGGRVAGMAAWFVTYSTWTGRHGIWVEDLIVSEAARGLGLGRALLSHLAGIAVAQGYARLELAVLDWNEPAVGFYRHLRARPMAEWTTYRVSGDDLARLATEPG